MHSVRKRILEILKEQQNGATVAELAEQLEMAPVSVRHHLDILQGDNLICVDRLERKGNVGRPQQIYTLTPEANSYFPNNFAGLAEKLVGQIKQMLPPEQVPSAFRTLARQIATEFTPTRAVTPQSEGHALEAHLEQVTEFLNERGYLARWERNPNGVSGEYLLHKYNCPYAGVSGEHRELCLMDQVLVDELVTHECLCAETSYAEAIYLEAERVEAMVEGSHCCTYHISGAVCPSVDRGRQSARMSGELPVVSFSQFDKQPVS